MRRRTSTLQKLSHAVNKKLVGATTTPTTDPTFNELYDELLAIKEVVVMSRRSAVDMAAQLSQFAASGNALVASLSLLPGYDTRLGGHPLHNLKAEVQTLSSEIDDGPLALIAQLESKIDDLVRQASERTEVVNSLDYYRLKLEGLHAARDRTISVRSDTICELILAVLIRVRATSTLCRTHSFPQLHLGA
jgi:hypothetical protein